MVAHGMVVDSTHLEYDATLPAWLRAREVAEEGAAVILEAVEKLRTRKAPKPMSEQSSDVGPPDTAKTEDVTESESSQAAPPPPA